MPANVAWVNFNPKAIARGYWDNELPERILKGQKHHVWQVDQWAEHGPRDGGVVMVVAGQHNAAHVAEINRFMASYPWVLLMVTGDEEGLFPWSLLSHSNIRTWAFAPNSPDAFAADRLLPFGPTPHGFTDLPKTLDWFFAGQVNTPERKAMAEALRGFPNGELVETDGFAKGLPVEGYVTVMNRVRVVPCPPAWKHPDTFRIWEALDAGAIPIVQYDDYWMALRIGGEFPQVDQIDAYWVKDLASDDTTATDTKAWWLRQQHEYRRWLWQDVASLGGPELRPSITTIVPTSPIPSHPSVRIINETINSVHQRVDGPVFVLADGVRPELEHRRADYEAYLRELVRLPGIIPVIHDEHLHQGVMTRKAMEMVDSPWLLFVEHDTPLTGSIPWDELMAQDADVIRLYPEARLEPEHLYLMGERDGAFTPTTQWSQRPHLARTDYYRILLDTYFGWQSRTMIEDVMHGVADNNPEDHRILIYTPEGDIQRSLHLDGRGSDSKFESEFRYEYDGEPPPGAPWPTSRR